MGVLVSMILREMNRIAFRLAIPSDHVRIASLHTENWRSSYRGVLSDAYLDHEIGEERERLWRERFLAPDIDRRYVFLAEIKTDLVGFVCVLLDEEIEWGACLDNLHVRSHIRGQGLGRQLFAKAARWVMVKQPGWPIHAWVFEANDSARRFYDTVKGEILEREVKQMPGGARVPSLRYVWRDLRILVNHLTHRSSGRADARS
jgi:GNAT superfamily N-acetyltransferase